MYSQWVQTGGPNGGSANEIVQIGSELIVSMGNGGIYKSLDDGQSWKPIISGLPCNETITALVEHNGLIYPASLLYGFFGRGMPLSISKKP